MLDVQHITFFILAAVTIVSAIFVITRRNAVHSVIWLVVTLFSVGGIYLTLHAQFLFAVQIILYVGGIMVLFLFVIMLVNLDAAAKQAQFARQWPVALVTVAILSAELAYAFYRGVKQGLNLPAVTIAEPPDNTGAVALTLYQNYMLPVEIASLLLLVAMVGAVLMAKKRL